MTLRKRYGNVPALALNWSGSFEYSLEFATSIITSRNGLEQRMAMRGRPRAEIEFEANPHKAVLARHNADLIGKQAAEWFFPIPFRSTPVTLLETVGSSVIPVGGFEYWMQPDAYVIVDTGAVQEVHQIDSWDGATDRIAIKSLSAADWPVGSTVYYAQKVVFDDSVSTDYEVSNLGTVSVQYAGVPGSELNFPTISISPTQFLGHDLWERKPNWRETPEIAVLNDRRIVDGGRGVWDLDQVRPFNLRRESFGYSLFNRGAIEEVIAFFVRHKGRRGQFWVPSWKHDIVLREAVSAGAQSFETFDRDWFDAIKGSTVYNALYLPDGQKVRISDVSLTGDGNTEFDLQDVLTSDLTPESRVSFLTLCRFATDRLTIDWRTDSVAECSLTFTPLPNL